MLSPTAMTRLEAARSLPASRAACGQAGFGLWLFLVASGSLVGTLWFLPRPSELSFGALLYRPLALLTSVATLALAPGLLFYVAQRVLKVPRLVGWSQAAIGACFLGLLYTDTVLYRLLRYHVNSAVLNVVKTRGSEDAIHLGSKLWTIVAVSLTLMTVALYVVHHLILRYAQRRAARGTPAPMLLRPRLLCVAVFLPLVFLEKGVWAASQLTSNGALAQAGRDLPLHPRVNLTRLLSEEAAAWPRPRLLPEGALLAYPHVWPEIDPEGPRPDILVLVIDSWRADVFDEEVTPKMHAFARGSRVFRDHLSGGNGTRFGIFSMLYGLHGSYWFPMLEQRRAPVLVEVLGELGYERRVFSSASMNFPEFRDTAWVGLEPDAVDDEHGSRYSHECDEVVGDKVAAWLREPDPARPRFGFVLLDSPHQPYYSPPDGPYQPAAEELDYLELATRRDPALRTRIFNRYRNAVVHADRVAGRILDALEDSGRLDRTIVIVTGDHGEEFLDAGFWGHTSNFTAAQLRVPLILRGPGALAGEEWRPTSHLDLAATLLEHLGADPDQRAGWTLGRSLFDPDQERSRVVAGWTDLGLWSESQILRVPIDPLGGEIEVFDSAWHPFEDPTPRVMGAAAELDQLARECLRFLALEP